MNTLLTNLLFELLTIKYFSSSWFQNVPLGPPDIILGIHEAFKTDINPHRIDLSIGAYRDENGKPYPLR